MSLLDNLPAYCEKFLEIECKDGEIRPFKLNRVQLYFHEKIEAQKAKQGFVRIILIKGRQQGFTTYISARYYTKTIYKRGTKVFILSHESKTTNTIFEKVKKYQYCIEKKFKNFAPKVVSSNNNQLVFSEALGSKYTIGTAGNKDVGRGFTIQLLHLSEAAFYENPEEIEKGLVQTVADLPGTEIIYETTTNGQNFLYEKVKGILKNPNSEYQVIFIPWFWQEEYTADFIPANFQIEEDEVELVKKFNLTNGQLLWRRKKIEALNSLTSFKQEYPNTLEEAFEFSGESLVKAQYVVEARTNDFEINKMMPRIMGVDGARNGDRTVFVIRQGRKIIHWEKFEGGMTEPRMAELIANRINTWCLDAVFVDAAYGLAAVDILHQMRYNYQVFAVYFNSGATNADLFLNKRSEILCAVSDWFKEGADIPDNQEFADDILSIPFYKLTSTHKRQVPSKEDIKKEFGKSTDIMDATALTFTFPVNKVSHLTEHQKNYYDKETPRKSKLNSLNVKRGIK